MLAEAVQQGLLRWANLKRVQIAGRALVYGGARMKLDGHFPRWGVEEGEIDWMAKGVIYLFISGIAKPPEGPDPHGEEARSTVSNHRGR